MKIFYLLPLALCLFSCQSNSDIDIDPENLLIGNWIAPKYENETTIYQRASKLQDNAPGVSFQKNAIFTQRTSGWCGTPPLTFYDETGAWETQESLILITDLNFPGNYNLRIISIDDEQLIVKRELSEQEKDHRELMLLFNGISSLSNSVSCTDPTDWNYTPYGAKACGGPQGYIAYSNQIDTSLFFQKIEAYNLAEKQYNIKWSITSTCDIPQEPKSIACQNGYPILKY
ncbi:hypothetical protein [Snuella sedimenti]|uniref:Lipocalin-like domain-containing protein n=1 Tax=Snuella sedimenti TaxID=2798802 RepID=A0A8J7J250_9FLAO|nr:hypothetical protein [Snuella sedimenti]MBJ6368362.1 hypothetical protein [Snuella sedimenti]